MLHEYDIDDMLDLISGEREEAFSFEKALRLHEFKMWILFPEEMEPVISAGLAAIRVLGYLEKQLGVDYWESDPTETMLELFKNRNYKLIFDNFLNYPLYWTDAVGWASRYDIDKRVDHRIRGSKSVAEVMNYRFRADTHHLDSARRAAGIKRSIFLVSKFRNLENVGSRTLLKRWVLMKISSIWVYASHQEGVDFAPKKLKMRTEDFVAGIKGDADDLATINKVLGCYATMSERYQKLKSDSWVFRIPARVNRVHPPIAPLNVEELAVMTSYKPAIAD